MHYKYKYAHFFDNIPRTNFKELSGKLCIYGAGFQGLLTAHLLKKQNIDVLCFADIDENKQGTTYYGLPVISPEKMKELYPDATVIVTPYTIHLAYKNVKEQLGYRTAVTPYSLFLEFDADDFNKLKELPDWYYPETLDYHLDTFLRLCANCVTDYKIYTCDICLTEVCNLKCKECTSLMQCYTKPVHYQLEELKHYMALILKNRTFHALYLEGGEALLWKPLPEFLDFLCTFPNLLNIYLITNGTILPNDNLIKSLKNPKITLRISDYGDISKINELSEICKKHDIIYKIYLHKWYELSTFSKEPHAKEFQKRVFETCCKTQPYGGYLKDGKIFCCPIQANMHGVGFFKSSKSDYLDLSNESSDIQNKLTNFFNNPKLCELCKHCDGRGFTGKEVPPAVQLEKGEKIEVEFI